MSGGAGDDRVYGGPDSDYALARRSPKVLVGFSDVTALHIALLRHAGLVTFHGPMAAWNGERWMRTKSSGC